MSTSKSKPSLSDRLLRYSAIASVATGAMLSAAPAPVFADPELLGSPGVTIGYNASMVMSYALNFDTDTHPELVFSALLTSVAAWVHGYPADRIMVYGGPKYAAALSSGAPIGSTTAVPPIWGSYNFAFLSRSNATGNWDGLNPTDIRYLGIQYTDSTDGQVHFGWVELSIANYNPSAPFPDNTPLLTIHRYGRETAPMTAIPADVKLFGMQAASGLQTIAANAFTALGGALTWLRRKLRA